MRHAEWRGQTRKEFDSWPLKRGVLLSFYDAIRSLQAGEMEAPHVLMMKGFDGKVAEVKISGYRLIVYVGYRHAVYVISAFKRDSSSGRRSRKYVMNAVDERLKALKNELGDPVRRDTTYH